MKILYMTFAEMRLSSYYDSGASWTMLIRYGALKASVVKVFHILMARFVFKVPVVESMLCLQGLNK